MPRKPRENLRNDLIEYAQQLLQQEGLQGLTARRLASGVGCAVGSIYNVVADLDDLLIEVHGLTLDRLYMAITEGPAERGDVEARLLGLAGRYIAFTEANRNLWLALFEHRLPAGRELPHWYLKKLSQLFEVVEQVVDPLFPPEAVAARRRTARILWSALHGICSLGLTNKLNLISTDTVSNLADEMIVTMLAGLRTQAPVGGASRSSMST